ncbi:MAG: aminoglycoside phosphotransferase family protein [Oscillospiraceae bacterium]|jgi:aminoglycoside phosphotransferase (APT) family kinase protein|nr:aminoglycoside phosphotransferase family protein [Oscillospiraceae bacterium]
MNFFTHPIASRRDWSKVYQSIPAFTPLAEYILRGEGLPVVPLEHLTPGTNAVFRTGGYVLKIFAPPESGFNLTFEDMRTEAFALRRAERLGVCAPKLIAQGCVEDKYSFAYMIMEFIPGIEFTEAVKAMTDAEKLAIGQKLRAVTDRMNTPCAPFNSVDALHDKTRWAHWDAFPKRFQEERAAWIDSHGFGEFVFVHGDLGEDNILISPDGELCIIDFADALLAPVGYEHALLAAEFDFDSALMRGYFGDEPPEALAERCFAGTLIHHFGGDIVADRIAPPSEIHSLEELRRRVHQKVEGAFL